MISTKKFQKKIKSVFKTNREFEKVLGCTAPTSLRYRKLPNELRIKDVDKLAKHANQSVTEFLNEVSK